MKLVSDKMVEDVKQPEARPHRVLIMGAGRAGTAFLKILSSERLVEIAGVLDNNPRATGLALARERGIKVFSNMGTALDECEPCLVFNLTGDRALEMLVSEVLGPGFIIGNDEARLIWRMLSNLHATKEKMSHQAMHDVLTGKYNRRFLLESARRGLSEARRYRTPYSIALFDIDRFKLINDHYGHVAGDGVLKAVADHLESHVRDSDTLGRWGGEEFLMLLPHTREKDATMKVDKLLAGLKCLQIDVGDGKTVSISFSAGVVDFHGEGDGQSIDALVDELLVEVDRRLYRAKARGRGCVEGAQEVDS
ncbi:MAG: diguanylate cyclase [Mariprofundaceae bacterium]